MSEPPVACSLSPRELRERRAGIIARLRRHREETRVLPDGIAVQYDASTPEVLAALGEFIAAERQCCPFLRFRLTVEPGAGPVWLELTGPSGTREFLEREIYGAAEMTAEAPPTPRGDRFSPGPGPGRAGRRGAAEARGRPAPWRGVTGRATRAPSGDTCRTR